MNSLISLQLAVLNDDKSALHQVLNEIDRTTENELFRKAGEHFGFATAEACGTRVANRSELSRVFGYGHESGLRMLAERYDLEATPLAGYAQNVRSLLIEALGLSKFDSKASLCNWQTFLLAAMTSTNKEADAMKLYLLNAERATRVALGLMDYNKVQNHQLNRASKIVSIAARLDRMKDLEMRKHVQAHLNELLDGALGEVAQGNLFGQAASSGQ